MFYIERDFCYSRKYPSSGNGGCPAMFRFQAITTATGRRTYQLGGKRSHLPQHGGLLLGWIPDDQMIMRRETRRPLPSMQWPASRYDRANVRVSPKRVDPPHVPDLQADYKLKSRVIDRRSSSEVSLLHADYPGGSGCCSSGWAQEGAGARSIRGFARIDGVAARNNECIPKQELDFREVFASSVRLSQHLRLTRLQMIKQRSKTHYPRD